MKQTLVQCRLVLLLVVTAFAVSVARAWSSPIEGAWQGEMVRHGVAMSIRIEFRTGPGRTTVWFSSESWGVMEWPAGEMSSTLPNVHFDLGGGDSDSTAFDGELVNGVIRGRFTGREGSGAFALHRAAERTLPYTRTAVTFHNGGVTLAGTLLVPRDPGPHPAIVFVHGSGMQTRWGTPYFLADRFARRGVAALVYDKRGSGASSGDWRTATYNDLCDDALAGVHMLEQRADVRPDRVGALGHSEGGAVVALMAARSRDVAFIISADGPTGPMYKQDLYRVRRIVESHGFEAEDVRKAMAFYELWLQAARTGQGRAKVAAEAAMLQHEKWFDLVSPPPPDHWAWTEYRKRADFDSLTAWAKVTVPVLLVYGELDDTVPVSPSITAIEAALQAARNADYTPLIVPNAQHNLTVHPESGPPYTCPMHPQVSQAAPGTCPICQMALEPHPSAAWWHLASGVAGVFTAWTQQRVGPDARASRLPKP